MKNLLLALALSAAATIPAFASPSVLSLKESITDTTIVYPESFETDTHELMKNWYLQKYAVSDGTSTTEDVPTSKEDYIQRLQSMPTVIEMPYNQIVRSYIDMYTQRRRKLVEEMIGLGLYYNPIFEQALEKEGMPLELKYLPVIESALNPDAVSRVGATGLWQFMLATAKGLGLEVNSIVDERRDPIRSSEKAAQYLKQLYNIYNDWSLAIASYNCGPGNVNKALRRAGGGKKDFWDIYYYLPAETRGYVPAFIAANYVMNFHKDHNIGTSLSRRPVLTDTIQVNHRVHFKQISEVLNIPIEELRVLNPQYRKDIIPGDRHPYTLTLPSKQVYSYIVSEDSIITHDSSQYSRRAEVEPYDFSKAGDGKKLVIKYHKVKRNETLSKVARKYGVSTTAIKRWNRLRSNRLRRGQTLKIHTYVRDENYKKEDKKDRNDEVVAQNSTQNEEVVEQRQETERTTTTHKVRSGETLGKIAEKYGVTVSQLKKWNNLRSTNIKVGQRLKVQTSGDYSDNDDDAREESTTYHKVRRGESLSTIAEKYGVSVSDLKEWNNLRNSSIDAGQNLVVNGRGARTSSSRSSSSQSSATTHTVRNGESLYSIAHKYGVSINDLKEWNNISGNDIKIGQKLSINGKKSHSSSSASSTRTHTVRKGETLGQIAEKYGVGLSKLRRANGISGSNIRVGQKLKIPR